MVPQGQPHPLFAGLPEGAAGCLACISCKHILQDAPAVLKTAAVLQSQSTPEPLRVYPARVNDYGKIYVKFTKD